MLPFRSIKSLYPLALAEGEGLGTAYEYYAKRLVVSRHLVSWGRPSRLLIVGLPERYGSSLDLLLLAQDLAVSDLVVADDRAATLEKCRQSLAGAQRLGELLGVRPQYALVTEMASLKPLAGRFDLCLASEVLQRLEPGIRRSYVSSVGDLAPAFAFFAPNADNPSHARISGLSGLTVSELSTLIDAAGLQCVCGYVDAPPFPPGLTRSPVQRQHAANGRLEGLAMWALGKYAGLEAALPCRWQRHQAHIVYAVACRPTTCQQPDRG